MTGRACGPVGISERQNVSEHFAKDTQRGTVALSRAKQVIYVIGHFDYLTQKPGTPLFNYFVEAGKRTPVVDGNWYVTFLENYADQTETRDKANEDDLYPPFTTFGNGVLWNNPFAEADSSQAHITDNRLNRYGGWKDRRWFEADVPETYAPSPPVPFADPLEREEELQKAAHAAEKR